MSSRNLSRIVLGLILALLLAPAASAADLYWYPSGASPQSQGGNGTWNTSGSTWNSSSDGSGTQSAWNNANSDGAVFGGTAGTVTNSVAITAGSLSFLTSGYVITNGGLTNTLTLSGGTGVINVGSGMTANIRGSLSSSSLLTKKGTGTLALGGASQTNNMTGGIYLQEGEIRVQSGTAGMLGTTTLRMANGTTLASTFANDASVGPTRASGGDGYLIDNNATVTFNTAYSGTASTANNAFAGDASYGNNVTLIKTGQGTLQLNQSSANFGSQAANTWRVDQGMLRFSANNGFGSVSNQIVLNGGGVVLYGNNRTLTNVITLNNVAGNRIDAESTRTLTLGFANQLTGAGGFTKGDAGVLVLTASNNYIGGTTLSAGTLRAGNNSALGTGSLALNGGTLASDSATARMLTNAVTMGGDATLGESSTGTGNLTLSGTLALGAATRTLTVNNNQSELSGNISGNAGVGLTKSGSGTLVLSGTNTHSGTTTIGAGVLALTNGSAIADTADVSLSNIAGATLAVNSSETIGSLQGGGTTGGNVSIASGRTLTVAEPGSQTFAGAITNAGGLTKSGAGTLTLTASNAYTGATTVTNGVLALDRTGGGALSGTTSIGVGTGAKLLVSQSDQVNNSAAVTLSGGTIQRASGVSEVFGNLNLTESSFLDFGSTASAGSFTFGTFNPTASKVLTFLNFQANNSVSFSADSALSMSYFAAGSGSLGLHGTWTGSDTFTITAIPEPATVLAAIGLTGLYLWPMRRRLMGWGKGAGSH